MPGMYDESRLHLHDWCKGRDAASKLNAWSREAGSLPSPRRRVESPRVLWAESFSLLITCALGSSCNCKQLSCVKHIVIVGLWSVGSLWGPLSRLATQLSHSPWTVRKATPHPRLSAGPLSLYLARDIDLPFHRRGKIFSVVGDGGCRLEGSSIQRRKEPLHIREIVTFSFLQQPTH